ncbi:TIGR02217 family protein [Rhizobium sp. YIM 134829]|uniref:phage distal tail protein, Rcc01695 family n=1 Tax=Rhizobium sp. YIM 134829 TaxID=3390453 RepID=UPI0039797DD3
MPAGFHEVRFPLRLSLGTSGGPERRTEIVNLSNGREARNRRWRDARRRFDAGSGLKSLDDLYAVLAFFEARAGALYGFRFRDPLDFRSGPPGRAPLATDQVLGTGTGSQARFTLIKTYADAGGASQREIAKPVAGTVLLAVDGTPVPPARYTVDTVAGAVEFLPAFKPAAGAVVTAGYEFDVPVRFDTDRIEVDLAAFRAGRIPTIPLVEIKP